MADGAFHGAAADDVPGGSKRLVAHPVAVDGDVVMQVIDGLPLRVRALMSPEEAEPLQHQTDAIGGEPIELGRAPRDGLRRARAIEHPGHRADVVVDVDGVDMLTQRVDL